MKVLIADDDSDTRRLLTKFLASWDHEVIAASDGDQAIEILHNEPISLVISDWMMPKTDGIQLCRKIRSAGFDRYVYVILLTARNAKHELVAGMEAGADDFIGKPFNKGELKVRVRAGARMVDLQKCLQQKNSNLEVAYSVIEKDLLAAAELQRGLLPNESSSIAGHNFECLLVPSTIVAGDSLNFFKVDDDHIGFYLLDVAGHGIPAAMMSVTLSKILMPTAQHLLQSHGNHQSSEDFLYPSRLIGSLNEQFHNDYDAMRYFTMVYGLIDNKRNLIKISQAGHPSPILVKQEGKISQIEPGGMPVGMLPQVSYDEVEVDFEAGDRLIVYSDGITECTDSQMQQFGERRLLDYVAQCESLSLRELLDGVKVRLNAWSGRRTFADDVSILAIEKTCD